MGESAVDQNQMEQIGKYVKSHMGQWMAEENLFPRVDSRPMDKELLERMVKVEQQLIFSNERLVNLTETVDKRFESLQLSMDKRKRQFTLKVA